jgi:hypothetical protein
VNEVSETVAKSIEDTHNLEIFGIPQDIALVLAIDCVLISLRLAGVFNTNRFIGAKVLGTTALIGAHFL